MKIFKIYFNKKSLVIYCLIQFLTNEIINLETIFNLKMKKIEINKIYNKNCIEGMKLIPKNKIDLVITDPPFAINFKAKKSQLQSNCL